MNLSLFHDSLSKLLDALNFIKGHPKEIFIDHRTLLVLYKLYQYEQSPPQKKRKLKSKKLPEPILGNYNNV